MGQFPRSSHSEHRSSTRQTVPPYPSFTLVVLERSRRLRKTRTPVIQAVAGYGMTTFNYHPEPAYGDAHDAESTDIHQEPGLTEGTLEPTSDDSSAISFLDLGEPAVSLKMIKKLRNVMIKFRLTVSLGRKRKY